MIHRDKFENDIEMFQNIFYLKKYNILSYKIQL